MKNVMFVALVGALAVNGSVLAAQQSRDSTHTMKRASANGALDHRVELKVKVDQNVAATATVSADSAQTLALAQVPEGGKVNSGELHMEDGKLVYDVNVVPNGKKTVRKVRIDALTGEIVKDKQLGGLKGVVKKHEEHKKEKNADKAAAKDTTRKP
jgi:uncharacterized membrane protein YkoI